MAKRTRDSRLHSTSEVLQALFEKSKGPLATEFKRWKLWQSWEEVVGPTLAQNSLPVGLQAGILWVWVPNSVVMQEFEFVKYAMRDKVNERLGKRSVRQLRFTLDRKNVPNPEETAKGLREFLAK